ncbi:hypothetical protein [Metabacillus bambusae]|uniref:Uncharacterized protein n=1 Tax=Metabacillus bambusae TaxID=2795218 RepID=A0ABS3N3W6_9BACI|nr:hypothetical protein [Metabacillus bambusae]MBO1512928.1 hypothetical protein [Metabacillus bambusae]
MSQSYFFAVLENFGLYFLLYRLDRLIFGKIQDMREKMNNSGGKLIISVKNPIYALN